MLAEYTCRDNNDSLNCSLECRSWAGLMCVVLLLVETTLAGEKRQVFNSEYDL